MMKQRCEKAFSTYTGQRRSKATQSRTERGWFTDRLEMFDSLSIRFEKNVTEAAYDGGDITRLTFNSWVTSVGIRHMNN
jgi:hypothetical protein